MRTMRLRDIAFDNLKRRKSRVLFLSLGMVIGIATIVTLFTVTQVMQQDIQKKLDEFGANIMLMPETNTLAMSYGGISIPGAQYDLREIEENDLQMIYGIKNKENLATVSPKLLGSVEIEGNSILLVGANLGEEISLKKWWKLNSTRDLSIVRVSEISPVDPTKNTTKTRIKGLDRNDILIGYRVAEILDKALGDKLVIKGKDFSISAIIQETGSQDDSIIFMDLEMAQELLGKENKITLVEVAAICSGCPVEEMARQITDAVPGAKATPIKQVVEGRMQTLKSLNNFGFSLGVIILLIGSLVVFTTMTSSVNERTREIGIFRAIGFRRVHIVKIILMEALVLSLISGIIGYVLGTGFALIIAPEIAGMEIAIQMDLLLASGSVLLAVTVGTLATIYPALRASRIDPVEALRHI